MLILFFTRRNRCARSFIFCRRWCRYCLIIPFFSTCDWIQIDTAARRQFQTVYIPIKFLSNVNHFYPGLFSLYNILSFSVSFFFLISSHRSYHLQLCTTRTHSVARGLDFGAHGINSTVLYWDIYPSIYTFFPSPFSLLVCISPFLFLTPVVKRGGWTTAKMPPVKLIVPWHEFLSKWEYHFVGAKQKGRGREREEENEPSGVEAGRLHWGESRKVERSRRAGRAISKHVVMSKLTTRFNIDSWLVLGFSQENAREGCARERVRWFIGRRPSASKDLYPLSSIVYESSVTTKRPA